MAFNKMFHPWEQSRLLVRTQEMTDSVYCCVANDGIENEIDVA